MFCFSLRKTNLEEFVYFVERFKKDLRFETIDKNILRSV